MPKGPNTDPSTTTQAPLCSSGEAGMDPRPRWGNHTSQAPDTVGSSPPTRAQAWGPLGGR